MTSNQIAYAAEKETERHNKAVEEETQRNNKVLEGLKERDTYNEELRQQNDAWYKQESARINREYNDMYYKLGKAAQDEKEWYESQLVALEEQKNWLTKDYNNMMNARRLEENLIKENLAAEDKRHNQEMERINADVNYLNWKKLDFERTQFRETLGLKWSELDLQRQKLDFNYEELNLNRDRYYMEYETRGVENLLRKDELELKKMVSERELSVKEGLYNKQLQLMQSEKIRNYADIFTKNKGTGDTSAINFLKLITPLFF